MDAQLKFGNYIKYSATSQFAKRLRSQCEVCEVSMCKNPYLRLINHIVTSLVSQLFRTFCEVTNLYTLKGLSLKKALTSQIRTFPRTRTRYITIILYYLSLSFCIFLKNLRILRSY